TIMCTAVLCITNPPYYFLLRPHHTSLFFPYTTLFRSSTVHHAPQRRNRGAFPEHPLPPQRKALTHRADRDAPAPRGPRGVRTSRDRKSTRLNSSHVKISYAVFCLKKKNR